MSATARRNSAPHVAFAPSAALMPLTPPSSPHGGKTIDLSLLDDFSFDSPPRATAHRSAAFKAASAFNGWGRPASASSSSPGSPNLPPPRRTSVDLSDDESSIGYDSDAESDASGAHTPKGHPIDARKSNFSRKLGLARFGFSRAATAAWADQGGFERRETARRLSNGGGPVRASPAWSLPKIRVPKRTRPALYATLGLISFLVFAINVLRPSKPEVPLVRKVLPVYLADAVTTRAAVRHRQHGAVASPRGKIHSPAVPFEWPGRDVELAALLNFIFSEESHTVPVIDPAQPLSPELILDFDTTKPIAAHHMHEMQTALWKEHPVVLLSRERNAHSRFLKSSLDGLHISPAPLVMDADQRPDFDVLLPLLQRLLGPTTDLPILFVGGKLLGGWPEVDALMKRDALKPLITSAGATLLPPKKPKKKGHGAKSDAELQRVLQEEMARDEARREAERKAAEVTRLDNIRLEGMLDRQVDAEGEAAEVGA